MSEKVILFNCLLIYRKAKTQASGLREIVDWIISHKNYIPHSFYCYFLNVFVEKYAYRIYGELDREDSPLCNEYRSCFGLDENRYLGILYEPDYSLSETAFRALFPEVFEKVNED